MPTKKILPEFAEVVAVIAARDTAALQARLASGIDVNGTDYHGRTLLMQAAEFGNEDATRLLLAHGAKLNTRDRMNFHDGGGKTALHRAVQHRHLETAKILIDAGADLEVQDKLGETPLHLVVANGDLPGTELLLAAGANPNGSERPLTPLSSAAVMGLIEIARALLAKGADPNHPANARNPVLASAVFSKKPELVRVLLEAGAQVNARDENDKTALDVVGLTVMPESLKPLVLTPEQMCELREKIAAAAVIKSILLEAGAQEITRVA